MDDKNTYSLEDVVELHGEHDLTLDLQLTAHVGLMEEEERG